MLKIELLGREHNRNEFDCGNTFLNNFLRQTARQHITKGISRTFVLVEDEKPLEIIGFYTLTVCEVETETLPRNLAKKYPDTVPAVKLARLAVSIPHQSGGYGDYLIAGAVNRVIAVSDNVGIIGLFVDAKDQRAKEYYEKFGFIPLADNPLLLFLPLKTILQCR